MEAPTPNKFKKKNLNFKCDEKKYCLTLSCETNLIICINYLEKNKFFEKEFSYDEITKINRYFLIFESIQDIFEEFSSLINDQTKIELRENSLILKIFVPNQKNKEALFMLNLKKMKAEDEISFLKEKINEQQLIIKEQNSRILNQENDIKLLKEKTANLENRISSIESLIKNKGTENLIKNEDETISKLKRLIGKKCELKLLYQMKRDGNSCGVFHKIVDNQGPTITLFLTEDGYKFGGYTSKSFKTVGGWINDPDSFLFDFLNLNKYPIKDKNYDAIFLGDIGIYGPEFYDILINSSDIKKGKLRTENYINNFEDLNGGNKYFINKDVFVYKVEFI